MPAAPRRPDRFCLTRRQPYNRAKELSFSGQFSRYSGPPSVAGPVGRRDESTRTGVSQALCRTSKTKAVWMVASLRIVANGATWRAHHCMPFHLNFASDPRSMVSPLTSMPTSRVHNAPAMPTCVGHEWHGKHAIKAIPSHPATITAANPRDRAGELIARAFHKLRVRTDVPPCRSHRAVG